ncbi:MAG: hypothetical protein MN733_01750 [Nitrososphaera sp.]|nr:hypothetical protein [Nitrososphaera sp.]
MDKYKWHRRAIAKLTSVARELGIETKDRKIRSNKGGNAVGGEVTMSAPGFGVYVHLHCPINSYGEKSFGGSYARRATQDDPYGTGIDKPNHLFQYTTKKDLVNLIWEIRSS